MAENTTPGDDARDPDEVREGYGDDETRELPADRNAQTQQLEPAERTAGEPTAVTTTTEKRPAGERLRPFAIPAAAAAVALVVGGIGGYGIAQASGAGTLQSSAAGPIQSPSGGTSGYGTPGSQNGSGTQDGSGTKAGPGAAAGPGVGAPGAGSGTAPTDAPTPPTTTDAKKGTAKGPLGAGPKGSAPTPPTGGSGSAPTPPSGAPTPPAKSGS